MKKVFIRSTGEPIEDLKAEFKSFGIDFDSMEFLEGEVFSITCTCKQCNNAIKINLEQDSYVDVESFVTRVSTKIAEHSGLNDSVQFSSHRFKIEPHEN